MLQIIKENGRTFLNQENKIVGVEAWQFYHGMK